MRIIVLTNAGSRFGLEILNEFRARDIKVDTLLLIQQPLRYYKTLFEHVRKRVGFVQAFYFATRRLVHDFLSSRGQRRREDFISDVEQLAERVIRTRGTNTPETLQILRALAPDVIAIGQTGILRPKLLEIPRLGTLNAHPGVLPNYRGIDSFQWAVLNGEIENVGVTVHWVDRGVDTGPIVRVERFTPRDEPLLVYEDWLFRQSARLLADTVAGLDPERIVPGRPQGLEEGRQYYKMTIAKERTVRRLLRTSLAANNTPPRLDATPPEASIERPQPKGEVQ
jgi:folate-dependent phosphoribosylglycinamide formyltransferase PurN